MRQMPSPDKIATDFASLNDSESGKYLERLIGFSPLGKDLKEPAKVVLGSRSPRRELILGKLLGIEHKCLILDVDEHFPTAIFAPDIVSKCLSAQKLVGYMKNPKAVAKSGNILIVSDTIVVGQDGRITGKEPTNLKSDDEKYEFCLSRIMNYMGKETMVYSSVAIADLRTKRILIGCDSVIIHFCRAEALEKELIKRYCRHIYDKEKTSNHRGPLGKAGSFGIQEPEILCIVERMEGDITVAVGLPANLTLRLLNTLHGFKLHEKYDLERCIDTIFADAIHDKTICENNLYKHTLMLIGNQISQIR